MTIFGKVSAAAVALVVTAGGALAVPIAAGSSFTITGAATHTDDPLTIGSVIEPTFVDPTIKAQHGDFATLIDGSVLATGDTQLVLDTGDVNNDDNIQIAYVGASDLGIFNFDITDTTYVTTEADPSVGGTLLQGTLMVTDLFGNYDPTSADWSFSYTTANGSGGWTLSVNVLEDSTPIPVPAALPMMAGGIALLGFFRRKAKV